MPEATAVTVGASFRRVLRASGAALLAVLVSLCTVACGTVPAQRERHPSFARQPAADSPLARIVNDSIADPALTGFRLMPLGSYSLDARVQLARRAHDSLDVQYYLIKADRAGGLFMRTLRDAALRGVRVRLLVDDLYTSGSDEMFSGLAAYPNVEVRLFNPFCCARGSTLGKYAASLADFGRLNHRMHNKLFIADGSAAVMGGRNIADEYFTWRDSGNFVDMDVLVIGAAIGRLRDIFDDYWNSPQAYPIDTIVPRAGTPEEARRVFERLIDEGEQMRSITLPPNDILGYGPIAEDLDAGRLGLVWGRAMAFADPPAKAAAPTAEMARSMSVQMNVMDRVLEATSEVVISSPYFVPGTTGVSELAGLRRRGVKVSVLTNSLAATDEPVVHVGYARYRDALLHGGVDLYELSPKRIASSERLRLPGASLGSLHAKAAVIDERRIFIGSTNLDPRSDSTNTELGIFADCPELAREMIRTLNLSKLTGAYRVRLAAYGGGLEWLSLENDREVVVSEEPEVTPWLRFKTMLLAPFVPEQLL
jgi:putative cardiolipin synthase